MKSIILKMLLVLIALSLLSCGPTVVRLSDSSYKTTSKVDILKEFPADREYEKIAILTITDEDHYPPVAALDLLVDKAKELGADALVVESSLEGISGEVNNASDKKELISVWAYAIKYK
jgi:hypothetical protein